MLVLCRVKLREIKIKIKKEKDSRETLLFFGFGAFLVVKDEKYIKRVRKRNSQNPD